MADLALVIAPAVAPTTSAAVDESASVFGIESLTSSVTLADSSISSFREESSGERSSIR